VRRLAELPAERVHPSSYVLRAPLSPHESARLEGARIELGAFKVPQTPRTLIVEGAGGLMVPLNDEALITDLIAQLGMPVVLVARTALGTINHTLLSLEALRRRGLPVAGVVLKGAPNEANRRAIATYGHVEILAEIPHLEPLDASSIATVAAQVAPSLEALIHG
jgi:malonyl-CoA O-methyltransferase